MTTLNTTDPTVTLPVLVAALRRGESVLLLDAGGPIGRVEPAPATPAAAAPSPADDPDDDDERPWRGVFSDLKCGVAPPGWKLPPDTGPPPPRLPPRGNLNWLPDRGDDDE